MNARGALVAFRERAPVARRQPPKRRAPAAADWGPPIVVKSAEAWRYQWHEEVLKRWDLKSRSLVAVAGVLMHAYRVDRGYAEIGLAQLAERAGCSRSTASAATMLLRRKGLIEVLNEGQRKPDLSLETCRFRLTYLDRDV